MRAAIRRSGRADLDPGDLEMAVYTAGVAEPVTTVVMVA